MTTFSHTVWLKEDMADLVGPGEALAIQRVGGLGRGADVLASVEVVTDLDDTGADLAQALRPVPQPRRSIAHEEHPERPGHALTGGARPDQHTVEECVGSFDATAVPGVAGHEALRFGGVKPSQHGRD